MNKQYLVGVMSVAAVIGMFGAGCKKQAATRDTEVLAGEKPVVAQPAKVNEPKPVAAAAKQPATAPWIKEYFGDTLLLADGSKVDSKELAGKTIGIYFSAHWCPPCRQFTPQLVKFYNQLQKDGKKFDIVFVSADRSAEAMHGYMTDMHMPWKGLPFGSPKKSLLDHKYGVRGIPTLIIVDKNGKTITQSGRIDVAAKGTKAFEGWVK